MHIPHKEILLSFLIIINFLFFAAPLYAATSNCKLSFQMSPGSSSIVSTGTITYAVSVKNVGTAQCRDVSVSLFYADNEQFVSSAPVPRASNYYWYIGNLGVNKTSKISVTTKHTGSGTSIISEGCASARNGADACASSAIAITTPVVVPSTPVATSTPMTASTTQAKENGIWVWNFASQMNTPTGDVQLKSLASYKFNAVYLTIDDYLDIAAMPEGSAKNAAKSAYFAQVALFVQKANALGMQVDAEGGANNWAMESNRWKGFALIDAVKEYNTLYPQQKLRGFQYDVEPYTLPDYETNKSVRLTEFVTFVDQSITRLVGSNVQFSIVIPHFYDSTQEWTPTISYSGTTTHTFTHLLKILEKKAGSTILIMSYRDFFDGPNGTKEISEVEIKEASGGYSTNIIVSQETGNVDPDFITFYGSSKKTILDMLATINAAFGSHQRYGGTATHYMDSFLEMSN